MSEAGGEKSAAAASARTAALVLPHCMVAWLLAHLWYNDICC